MQRNGKDRRVHLSNNQKMLRDREVNERRERKRRIEEDRTTWAMFEYNSED